MTFDLSYRVEKGHFFVNFSGQFRTKIPFYFVPFTFDSKEAKNYKVPDYF